MANLQVNFLSGLACLPSVWLLVHLLGAGVLPSPVLHPTFPPACIWNRPTSRLNFHADLASVVLVLTCCRYCTCSSHGRSSPSAFAGVEGYLEEVASDLPAKVPTACAADWLMVPCRVLIRQTSLALNVSKCFTCSTSGPSQVNFILASKDLKPEYLEVVHGMGDCCRC